MSELPEKIGTSENGIKTRTFSLGSRLAMTANAEYASGDNSSEPGISRRTEEVTARGYAPASRAAPARVTRSNAMSDAESTNNTSPFAIGPRVNEIKRVLPSDSRFIFERRYAPAISSP